MFVPEWFKKELEVIDPRYFVIYNDKFDYYQVKHRFEYVVVVDGRLNKREGEAALATYTHLNDSAVTDMRRRKQIGLKFQRTYNPNAYLQWIKAMNREANQKAHRLALEMTAEGLMKIYNFDRVKQYDMMGTSFEKAKEAT